MNTTTLTRCIAIPLGVAVFAVQVGIGLDYLGGWAYWGGKAKTIDIASLVLVFAVLALAPTIVVGAFRTGHPLAALALIGGFACWMTYSLPATLGRTAEVSEVKVKTAEDAKAAKEKQATLVDDALVWAKARLDVAVAATKKAQQAASARCERSPNSDACKNLKRDEEQAKTWEKDRQTRVDELTTQAAAPPPPPVVGDQGSETIAWAISFWKTVTAEEVRNSKNIGFALGLELFLWSLLHIGLCPAKAERTPKVRKEEPVPEPKAEPEPVPTFSGNVVPIAAPHPVVRALNALGGEASSNRQLANAMSVSDGESTKRVDEVEALGLVERQQCGKEVRIRLKRIA